uniref:Phosphatidylethanolamine N-methyltransferase n=2 Tax=Sus scrofa TaxID=9823 RepID=A0A8D0UNN8_PIG
MPASWLRFSPSLSIHSSGMCFLWELSPVADLPSFAPVGVDGHKPPAPPPQRQPTHAGTHAGRQMGTQDPQAEQGLRVTPPGLLHPGRRHPAPQLTALPLGVKDPALPQLRLGSQLGHRFDPWPRNFTCQRCSNPPPHNFTQAMLSQPQMESLGGPTGYRLGLALLGVGSVFVLSSFLALGFTGTFLGDYFGILMEARVTRFPFSVLDNPMYWGSTAVYLGWALMHASPTGLLLTLVVAAIYKLAILFEEPFTAEIYRQRGSQARKRS